MTGCPAASGLVMTTVAAAAATAAPPAVTGANADGSSERCNWAFTAAGKGESMVQDQAGTPGTAVMASFLGGWHWLGSAAPALAREDKGGS